MMCLVKNKMRNIMYTSYELFCYFLLSLIKEIKEEMFQHFDHPGCLGALETRNAYVFAGAGTSMNDLLCSFVEEHSLVARRGTKVWCFRSGSGDFLTIVDSLCVLG